MFSGIIRAIGAITDFKTSEQGARLSIAHETLARCSEGDSVAVSGVCLTVVSFAGSPALFDVSSETLRKTTLGEKRSGDRVNLEHPLSLSELVHGHLVQGHVDCVASVSCISAEGETRKITLAIPSEFNRYLVPKGSIAVDGVSLTVGEVKEGNFAVYVIPKTWEQSCIQDYGAGSRVNIEIDMVAKYLEKLSAAGA